MTAPRSDAQDRILDAAEAVFARKGYRGGALNDVAVEAGYTRAGLLHYFPSKEALLLALLDRRDEQVHALETIQPGDTVHDVLRGMPDAVRQIAAMPLLVQLGHIVSAEAASVDHPARDWVLARERTLRDDLTRSVELAQQRGELVTDIDSYTLGALILAAFEGLEGHSLVDDKVDVLAGMDVLRRLIELARP